MTFADLVAFEIDAMNPERVRQGKRTDPRNFSDFERAICRVFDKYQLVKPGVSGSVQRFSESVESDEINLEELGL